MFAAYEPPALVLFILLCLVTALSVYRPEFLNKGPNPALTVTIVSSALLIGLGAAYFALGEFILYGLLSSLYVGLAFLVLATTEAGFGLYPFIGDWLQHGNALEYGWGVQRITGGVLLVAASLLVQRQVPVARRLRMVLYGTVTVFILAAVVILWVYFAQSHSVALNTAHALQLGSGGLFFAASFLFWRASKTTNRTWFFWLAFSLGIAGFAQIEYALHSYPLGVVQPGDILNIVFFAGILLALVAQWTQDYRRLRWQARELEALQVLMTAPVVEDVPAVVEHVVKVVGESLHASARVLVADREQKLMRDPLSEQMLHFDAEPQNGRTRADTDRVVVGFDDGPDGQMALGVPLQTSTRRLGMLVVLRAAGDEFTSYDMRLLRALGSQASVLLERSLLYEEVAAGAILEERSRLAREIHDGLAQHLAFLKMRVSWLQRSNTPIERRQLKDVEGVLETALIEARHAITTLRAEPQTTSTREAIQGYVEEFGQVAGITVDVHCAPDVPDVGPKARVELLRIVQESLNNVRKHAQATAVSVALSREESGLEVRICDNGAGFEVDRNLEGHFGLQIMSERATSVGGRFEVQSAPRQGAEVRIWVPLQDTDSADDARSWLRLAETT